MSLALFLIVALGNAWRGETSCGCFGAAAVPPLLVVVLDAAALIGLLLRRRFAIDLPLGSPAGRRVKAVALAGAAFVIPVVIAGAALRDGVLSSNDGLIRLEDGAVVAQPKKWLGRRFPLLSYIDIGTELARGSWRVVIYRPDCPQCDEAIAKYSTSSNSPPFEERGPRLALIRIPLAGDRNMRGNDTIWHGSLRRDIEWFVPTPAEIILHDGVVTRLSVQGK